MSQHRTTEQVKKFDIFKIIVLVILLLLLFPCWFLRPGQGPSAGSQATTEPTVAAAQATAKPVEATSQPVPAATEAESDAATTPVAPTLDQPGELTAGEVTLTGTGEPGSEVEIVVDGKVVGQATVGSDGKWSFDADLSKAGKYKISVQSVGEAGSAGASSEERSVAVAAAEDDGQAYIVQADDWLTKLALKFYSDMTKYPAIVEATNAKAQSDSTFDVITNPDLIEIGQKLWIPAEAP